MLKLEREDVHKVLGRAKEICTSGRTNVHYIFFDPDMTKLERDRKIKCYALNTKIKQITIKFPVDYPQK